VKRRYHWQELRKDKIKFVLGKQNLVVWTGFFLVQDRDQWMALVSTAMNLGGGP
jgi:hypothetical protein